MLDNPYIMLGIPYGASRDVAQAAFARRARKLRRQSDGAGQLTQLTWALNQIDEVLKRPENAVGYYRIPSDPSAFVPDQRGVLNPDPERMKPRYRFDDVAQADALQEIRAEALEVLSHEVSKTIHLPER